MQTPIKTIAVGTRATPEQVARWQLAAGEKTLSEWVRETLDRSVERDEILRRLELLERFLLNVGADLSAEIPITRERIRQYRDGS